MSSATGRTLYGDAGDDRIYAGDGNDIVYGGSNNDRAADGDGSGDDFAYLGAGDDVFDDNYLNSGNDEVYGGLGNDRIWTGDGDDYLAGDAGEDHLSGEDGDDVLVGGVDNDILDGDHGDDALLGGAGDDQLNGSLGDDVLNGGSGNDLLDGGQGRDVLQGSVGDDKLYGQQGDDTLLGGQGEDTLEGGEGDDVLDGGTGNDHLLGESGNDFLHGNEGDDHIEGGVGDDTLIGGEGDDSLTGGSGSDTFFFSEGDGVDVITDAENADKLKFDSDVNANEIWFSRVGDDLQVRLLGSTDSISLDDWYLDTAHQVTSFELDDGTQLLSANISSLVTTMASWAAVSGNNLDDLNEVPVEATAIQSALSQWYNPEDTITTEELVPAEEPVLTEDPGNWNDVAEADADVVIGWDRWGAQDIVENFDLSTGTIFVGWLDPTHLEITEQGGDTVFSVPSNNGHTLTLKGVTLAELSSSNFHILEESTQDMILTLLQQSDVNAAISGNMQADVLTGTSGADVFLFGEGDGADVIEAADNGDTLKFGDGVDANEIWFSREGDDLQAHLLGSNDSISLDDWYVGSAHQVASFELDDGTQLLSANIPSLVTAMSSWTAVSGNNVGDLGTVPNEESSLQVALANWQKPAA